MTDPGHEKECFSVRCSLGPGRNRGFVRGFSLLVRLLFAGLRRVAGGAKGCQGSSRAAVRRIDLSVGGFAPAIITRVGEGCWGTALFRMLDKVDGKGFSRGHGLAWGAIGSPRTCPANGDAARRLTSDDASALGSVFISLWR